MRSAIATLARLPRLLLTVVAWAAVVCVPLAGCGPGTTTSSPPACACDKTPNACDTGCACDSDCTSSPPACACDVTAGACDTGCACDPDCTTPPPSCACDATAGACDTGCACDPDCTTPPPACACDVTAGACDTGCACDPDCGTPPPPACTCDVTAGACDTGCACDPDCGTPPPPACTCDVTAGACDTGCACDPDCGAPPPPACACDVTAGACDTGCACDPDCGTPPPPACTCDVTAGACDTGCACDPDCGTPPPPACACDVTAGACDTGCACDPDCGTPPPPACACDVTAGACDTGCACDPDCGTPPPPACACDVTAGACDTGCACDPDCGTPPPPTCACDVTAGVCDTGCACDPDCTTPPPPPPPTCACDVTAGVCDTGCTCDPDCTTPPPPPACACDVTAGACDVGCTCDADCYDCTAPNLIAPYTKHQTVYGLMNGQDGCQGTVDASGAWTSLKIVVCQNGQLVTREDCSQYFSVDPNVYCAPDPSRTIVQDNDPTNDLKYCMTSLSGLDACSFYGLAPGEQRCWSDDLTTNRFLVSCWSSAPPVSPQYTGTNALPANGYVSFTDCGRGDQNGLGMEGVCDTNPVEGIDACIPGPTSPRSDIYDDIQSYAPDPTYVPNQFPSGQNLVSCGNPTNENTMPYVELDRFGQLFTDYDEAIVSAGVTKLHTKNIGYLGYGGFWGPEQRPGLSWYDPGYQYGYWRDVDGLQLVPDACWDADGDGMSNQFDNCPTTYNPDQKDTPNAAGDRDQLGDACAPPEGNPASFNDYDGDGVPNDQDNCPMVANPAQTDTDNDGIGDACASKIAALGVTSCGDQLADPATQSVLRVDMNGQVSPGLPMSFAWDLCQPMWKDAMLAILKLAVDAGLDGYTLDVATTADCYSDSAMTDFAAFVGATSAPQSPYHGVYLAAAAEVAATGQDLASPSFDARAFRVAATQNGTWTGSKMELLWTAFENEETRAAMSYLVTNIQAYQQATHPGAPPFQLFFNHGEGVDVDDLKGVAGGETFVALRDPTTAANYGFNDDARPWPQVSLEYLYDLHEAAGKRFWNWTIPALIGDDRTSLALAEALANGGIGQVAWCQNDYLAPYAGFMSEDFAMRNEQMSVAQFASDNQALLGLARAPGRVGVYWTEGLAPCRPGRGAAIMMYEALRALHYDVQMVAGGPFGTGAEPARPPTRAELLDSSGRPRFDFIIVPGFQSLSQAETGALDGFVAAGGILVAPSDTGSLDEACDTRTPSWTSTWTTTPNANGGFYVKLTGNPLASIASSVVPSGAGTGIATVRAMGVSDAFAYSMNPNTWVDLSQGNVSSQLVDIGAVNTQLRTWLASALSATGATPSFGAALPRAVHYAHFVDAAGNDVYDLVNYAFTTVPETYDYATNAGSYQEYTNIAKARTTEVTGLSLAVPVPSALQATGGTLTLHASADPHAASHHGTTTTVAFGPGSTTVTVTLDMWQWAILSFD